VSPAPGTSQRKQIVDTTPSDAIIWSPDFNRPVSNSVL
jgi:hypothetical protein